VQMSHLLSPVWTTVKYKSIPVLKPFLISDFARHDKHVANQVAIGFHNLVVSRDRFPGNHQYVNGCHRIDVSNRKTKFVLVDKVAGYLSGLNSLKKCSV